jgi:hemoglobin
MSRTLLQRILVSLLVALAGALAPAYAQQASLYERLGGYNAISAVVEDFAPKLFKDPQVGRFFVGMSTDSRSGFKQKNKNLICNVTGGPCQIISRPAKTAHAGLGITESDFAVVVGHLVATLNKFKVPAAEQTDLLNIIGTLKPDIVERK